MGLRRPLRASNERGGLDTRMAEPEEVFLAWVMACPPGTDLRLAAVDEVERLDGYCGDHPGPRSLKALFEEFLRRSGTQLRMQ
jgi:hypothetical protein